MCKMPMRSQPLAAPLHSELNRVGLSSAEPGSLEAACDDP